MINEALKYKCPNCDGELKYRPETRDFGCDYCGSSFNSIENSLQQPTASNAADTSDFKENTGLYSCRTCGAEVICDNETAAMFCYYCHEPIILTGRLSGNFKPDKVLPFTVGKEKAVEKFKDWCKKRRFCPKEFRNGQVLERMTGLYVPFWIANCNVDAYYSGIAKKVRTWTSGDYRYTETMEFDILRDADIRIDGLPADGASKVEDALMEAIEPYNYDEMKPFSMSYLSGFYADKYDITKEEMYPRIAERAEKAADTVIRDSVVGYSSVNFSVQRRQVKDTEWEYALLPVWFMTYKYNGELHSFAMNGQTGKISGTPPLDKKKLTLFSVAAAIAAAGLTVLIGLI